MKVLVLEGSKLYEDGKLIGPLDLQEGERAGPFIIIETCSGVLDVVEPTMTEASTTLKAGGSSRKHLLSLEGRFQMSDTKTANGRIYPNSIWDKVFEGSSDVLKMVDRGEMLGESDHPKDGETRLSRVAGKVSKLWRDSENKKEIKGRFSIFDTEAGRNLLAIHEGGGRLGVSSRGQGSVVRMGGHDVVQEDFKLQTWDVVHNPSTPGAYPEEVMESVDGPTTQQETDMSRLADLEKRLTRLRKREWKMASLSEDAVALIREDVKEIQESLTEGTFDSPGKQAKLVTEATNFLRDLQEGRVCNTCHKPGKIDDPTGTCVNCVRNAADDVRVGKKPKGPKPFKAYNEDGEEQIRAATADDLVIMVMGEVDNPPTDLQEATKVARKTYREIMNLEGPMSAVELEGVAKAAKALIEKSKQLDTKGPVIRATITHPTLAESEGNETLIEVSSERELQSKVTELLDGNPHTLVEVDRSEAVYAECAKRFTGLLETQTLKADQAVRDGATNQVELSEISAKLAGAKQLIEGFAAKHKEQKGQIAEVVADLAAAITIMEAVGSEFRAERLRGAVVGIAATHPRMKGLSEALSNVSSIEDAISATSKLQEASRPPVLDREPDQIQAAKVAEKLNEAARKEDEQKQARALTENKRPQGGQPVDALTLRVVADMPNPRG